jgi:hypothetical protein
LRNMGVSPGCGVMFVTSCTSVAPSALEVQRLVAEGVPASPRNAQSAGRVLLAAFAVGKPTPLFLEMLYKPPRPSALQINPNNG